jgi:hypothetical protein
MNDFRTDPEFLAWAKARFFDVEAMAGAPYTDVEWKMLLDVADNLNKVGEIGEFLFPACEDILDVHRQFVVAWAAWKAARVVPTPKVEDVATICPIFPTCEKCRRGADA